MSVVYDREDPSLAEGQKNPIGQHAVYPVLWPEGRTKGFVRPVRNKYTHKGQRLRGTVRPLTDEEKETYGQYGYVGFVSAPASESPIIGTYLTQEMLGKFDGEYIQGCGVSTKMRSELAETYARDPKFYGATFCVGCNRHLPVDEFEWEDGETVGS